MDDIRKSLRLTDIDIAKLKELLRGQGDKLRAEFPDFVLPRADLDTRRKYSVVQAKLSKETLAKFIETLTDGQKKKWQQMIGEPSAAAIASPGLPLRGPQVGILFSPVTLTYYRLFLAIDAKALDELKVEKAARDGIAEGLKEIGDSSQPRFLGSLDVGRVTSLSSALAAETTTAAISLLTSSQAKRLEQIEFQLSGTTQLFPLALRVGIVTGTLLKFENLPLVATLTLTPLQATKIDAIMADAEKKTRALGNPFQFMRPRGTVATEEQTKAFLAYQQQSFAVDRKALADILATFDAGQKVIWKEKAGEPFDTSKLRLDRSQPRFGGTQLNNRTVASVWGGLASSRMRSGHYAGSLSAYDEAIRLAPTDSRYLFQKAMLLATCPSEWVRDGKQALEIAHKQLAGTKDPSYALFNLLAAAHAELGQFDEAVRTQEQAIARVTKAIADSAELNGLFGSRVSPALKLQYEARLKLYQEKKPYRMSVPNGRRVDPGFGPGGQ